MPGTFAVKQGVPSRNGTRKHSVVDYRLSMMALEQQTQLYKHGQKVDLSTGVPFKFDRPLCGDLEDAFMIGIRMYKMLGKARIHRKTGHHDMHQSLWMCEQTSTCPHPSSDSQEKVESSIPQGVCIVLMHADMDGAKASAHARVVVFPTGDKIAARWRCLVALRSSGMTLPEVGTPMLRTKGCC